MRREYIRGDYTDHGSITAKESSNINCITFLLGVERSLSSSEGCNVTCNNRKSDFGSSGNRSRVCGSQTSRSHLNQPVPKLVHEIGEHAQRSMDSFCNAVSKKSSSSHSRVHTHLPRSGPISQGYRIQDSTSQQPKQGDPAS